MRPRRFSAYYHPLKTFEHSISEALSKFLIVSKSDSTYASTRESMIFTAATSSFSLPDKRQADMAEGLPNTRCSYEYNAREHIRKKPVILPLETKQEAYTSGGLHDPM